MGLHLDLVAIQEVKLMEEEKFLCCSFWVTVIVVGVSLIRRELMRVAFYLV